MFGVFPGAFDHEVDFVGAVDFPEDAVEATVRQREGFGEVVQAVEALGVMIAHQEDRTGAALGPGDQGQMIGAEVEHRV